MIKHKGKKLPKFVMDDSEFEREFYKVNPAPKKKCCDGQEVYGLDNHSYECRTITHTEGKSKYYKNL